MLTLVPLITMLSVLLGIIVSSRVNDARTAQQFAVLIVVPLVGLLVGQIAGAFILTTAILVWITIGLVAVWVVLVLLSVALFDRESILTRWK